MWNRLIATVCAAFVLSGPAVAGEMTSGLTISGGQNAAAALRLERANDPVRDDGTLTVRLSLSQARNLKGYGLTLHFDDAKYAFLKASEPRGNLLASRSDRETLFLTSDRTPGQLHIAAVKIDGQGASGEGSLVDLVFETSGPPSASDFQVSESVLVGLDGASDALSRVEIGNLTPLPDRYGLKQNTPNPFNPSTAIGYQLPEAGRVRLVVYNLLGQEVRVLVDERMEAGSFTATWDGADASGRRVASGVYLYRMQAGRFSDTRRMLLLK